MSFRQGTEEYYQKFIELQEKLRKSEEERLKLEMKFNEMVQQSRDEEQAYYHKLRSNYKQFLDENKKRQERNDKIMRLLERIESRAAVLEAKTQRFKFLRKHYQNYLDVQSRRPIEQNKPQKELSYDLKLPDTESKEELLKKYFDQLDAVKSRYSSDKATEIADDIMNAIYKKNKDGANINRQKYPVDRFERTDKYLDNNNQSRLRNRNSNFNLQQSNPPIGPRDNYCGTDRLNRRDLPTNRYSLSNYSSDESGGDAAGKYSVRQKQPSELDKFAANVQNFHTLLDAVKIDEECGDKDAKQVNFTPDEIETNNENHDRKIIDNNGKVIYRNDDENISQAEKIVANTNAESLREQSPVIDLHDANEVLENNEMLVDIENNYNNIEIQNSFDIKNKDLDKVSKETEDMVKSVYDPEQLPQQVLNEQNGEVINGSNEYSKNSSQLNNTQPSEISKEESTDNKMNEIPINSTEHSKNEQYNNGQTIHLEDIQDMKHSEKDVVKDMEYIQDDQLPQEIGQNNDILNQAKHVEYDDNEQAIQYDDKLQSIQTSNQSENNKNHGVDNYDQTQYQVGDQKTDYDENGHPIQHDENNKPDIPAQAEQYGNGQQVQYENNDLPTQSDNSDQPIQYNNSGEVMQYAETAQVNQFDTQQYDVNGQPLQYETNAQQYDPNGQPIKYEGDTEEYDANGQSLQYDGNSEQYDDADGQPIKYEGDTQQYDENGQPLPYEENAQQYDANGQPIQYEEDMQQYDASGQPLQQYESNMQPVEYNANNQPIQYDENGQPIPYEANKQQYDENSEQIQYDENGQPIQYDENGQPIHYDQYGRQIHYDESGQAFLYDETGTLIPYTDYNEEQYAKDEASVLNSEVQQETTDISAMESSENITFGEKKDEADEKRINVLDLLETDSESKKQEDSNKISNESDFEFSNNS